MKPRNTSAQAILPLQFPKFMLDCQVSQVVLKGVGMRGEDRLTQVG